MEARLDVRMRDQLQERRRRLVEAQRLPAAPSELSGLLQQVDAALARFDAGTFGLCEVCHDPVELDRLHADPFVRFCLDHLDEREQRALERDLSMAAEVQRRLLPRLDHELPGWDIHYTYDAVGPVSGDYCDVVIPRNPEAGVLVAVGDVSGKGVAASLLSAHLSALFRTLDDVGLPARETLLRANRLFCESTIESHYATLVLARAHTRGEVELSNAAQAPPLIFRGGRVEVLQGNGLPLGMFADAPFRSDTVQLGDGDAIVLYTDGVSEARSPRGEEFGSERLSRALTGTPCRSAKDLALRCLDALEEFRAGTPPHDDATLLVLRRRARPAG